MITNAKVVQSAEQVSSQTQGGGSTPAPSLQIFCVRCCKEFRSRNELKRHKKKVHTDGINLGQERPRQNVQEWRKYLHPDMWHPAANLMPMCDNEDFDRLVADIRENGLKIPVVLFGDKVIDGRNRLTACDKAGVVPTFITLDHEYDPAVADSFDPVTWVLSTNLSRRHLSKSQVACILVDAGELMERLKAEAKSRQGTRSDIQEIVPESSKGQARDKLGALGGVSGRYVGMASALKDKSPSTFETVKTGKQSLSKVIKQTAWVNGEIHGKPVYKTSEESEATKSTPDPVAQLFMRVDRLLPQGDSFFCEGADSAERAFPQLIEDAIGQVPTAGESFTIAYRTYSNVRQHEALVDGKITHAYEIDELAQVLDAAAAYFADAALRVRKAAAGEDVPAAVRRARKSD